MQAKLEGLAGEGALKKRRCRRAPLGHNPADHFEGAIIGPELGPRAPGAGLGGWNGALRLGCVALLSGERNFEWARSASFSHSRQSAYRRSPRNLVNGPVRIVPAPSEVLSSKGQLAEPVMLETTFMGTPITRSVG
jgi:hypothetical protein